MTETTNKQQDTGTPMSIDAAREIVTTFLERHRTPEISEIELAEMFMREVRPKWRFVRAPGWLKCMHPTYSEENERHVSFLHADHPAFVSLFGDTRLGGWSITWGAWGRDDSGCWSTFDPGYYATDIVQLLAGVLVELDCPVRGHTRETFIAAPLEQVKPRQEIDR